MKLRRRVACLIAVVLVGCEPSGPVVLLPRTPHGGTLTALPDLR